MLKSQSAEERIFKALNFIQDRQRQMETLRQQINHQIMFNLPDIFMAIADNQKSISLKNLTKLVDFKNFSGKAIQKFIKWNNQNTSLNLSFVQFSALLITKEDRLLAKLVLERQGMGAIPNFLLQIVKKIMNLQLAIHQYCLSSGIRGEQLMKWLQSVTDQNGDLDTNLFNQFISDFTSQSENQQSVLQDHNVFMRYLSTTGNITAERINYLLLQENGSELQQTFIKFQKMSTNITCANSPKSLGSYKSMDQIPTRTQYFDCLNRPIFSQDKQLRNKKSIQKHLKRIDSNLTKKNIFKVSKKMSQYNRSLRAILIKLKQIIAIEFSTENLRIQLCLCTDFYPVLFYDTIPKGKYNCITVSNFKDYLQQFGYCLQINQIYSLFRKYSKELGKLSFDNFCSIFDVTDPQYYLLEKNRFIESLNDVSISTKKLFFQLIALSAKNEQKINECRQDLLNNCIDINGALDALFNQYKLGISDVQLKLLYKKVLGYDLSRKQAALLWKRLSHDIKKQQLITKSEFLNQIFPPNIIKYKNKRKLN